MSAAFSAAGATAGRAEETSPSSSGLMPWGAYLDAMRPAGDLVAQTWQPESEQMRAEVYRQLMMNLSLGYFVYFQADAEHPDFGPFLNSVFLLQPNPDDNYWHAPLRGDRIYRVSGERGSVKLVTFNTGSHQMGTTAEQDGRFNTPFLDFDVDRKGLVHDGKIDVILSAERPAGYAGDWLHMDPATTYLLVTAVSYDWGVEADPRLAIECLNPSGPKPRMSVQQIDERLRGLTRFVDQLSRRWIVYDKRLKAEKGANTVFDYSFNGEGRQIQTYWGGVFDIEPGEALLLETELPARRPYWNVQLNDPIFNALEYAYRQSSLNGHQARIDSDGRFRAVICAEDPGVPNWLDTVGQTQGTFIGRWYDCDTRPLPKVTRLPVSEVRARLPQDTPSITPAERARVIAGRNRGLQMRRRW